MIIEYQKIINLLDNTPNHTSKWGTKNWFGMINLIECVTLVVNLNLT